MALQSLSILRQNTNVDTSMFYKSLQIRREGKLLKSVHNIHCISWITIH